MSEKKVTYKEIAHKLGVSSTTVHRALTGKGGVGKAMTVKIQTLAEEMGYQPDRMSNGMKKHTTRFAVVFPEPTMENRYYYLSLWNGAHRYFQEVSPYQVEVMDFTYPLTPGSNGEILKDIYENYKEKLDGLITIGVENNQTSYFLSKLAEEGIPITCVGFDLYKHIALCSVMAYDEMVGNLAAELLTAFNSSKTPGPVLITGNPVGSFSMPDQYHNASGFEQFLVRHDPGCSLLTAYSPDYKKAEEMIRSVLEKHKDLSAIYSTSARNTVLICNIIKELGYEGRVRLIGNDCFPESLEFLSRGILTGIIDKKVFDQSYQAAKILFEYAAFGEYPQSPVIRIQPQVVLKSHLTDVSLSHSFHTFADAATPKAEFTKE